MTEQQEREHSPRHRRRHRITWEQFSVAWRLLLGTGVIIYAVVRTAESAPAALPWVLLTGTGLVGLSITIPWERRRGDGEG